jgi:hypothetical protein
MKELKKYMVKNVKQKNILGNPYALNSRNKTTIRTMPLKNKFAKTFNQCNSMETF